MRNEVGMDEGLETGTGTGTGTGGAVGNAEHHYRCWGKLYGTPSNVTDVEDEAKGLGTGMERRTGRGRGIGVGDRYSGEDGDVEEDRDSTSEVVLSGLESTGGSSYM